jgi:hypothetical protein
MIIKKKLVENISESLASELKTWIDPKIPEGKAKLVRAAIALRNHNGGSIHIGYDDKTLKPDSSKHEGEAIIKNKYHPDVIQNLISEYVSEKFELKLNFVEDPSDGKKYPEFVIEGGVQNPVMTKGKEIKDNQGKILLKPNAVYVRTLESNGKVSSSEPQNNKDWRDLFDRCFHNREYSIASFFKRNLTQEEILKLNTELSKAKEEIIASGTKKAKEEIKQFFLNNEARCNSVLKERNVALPKSGLWEVGAIIKGAALTEHKTNKNFLKLLDTSNPRYTGWPVWVNSSNFSDSESRPSIIDNVWEALIVSSELDFWRIYPDGKFFLLRVLEDDKKENLPHTKLPHTKLEFCLAILRTAEAISTVIEFAKAMGYDQENTSILFGLKWTNLKGRELSAWANPRRYIEKGWFAKQNEFYHEFAIGLNTSNAIISQNLYSTINKLFNLFGGFEISYEAVDEWFNKLINRKLD